MHGPPRHSGNSKKICTDRRGNESTYQADNDYIAKVNRIDSIRCCHRAENGGEDEYCRTRIQKTTDNRRKGGNH